MTGFILLGIFKIFATASDFTSDDTITVGPTDDPGVVNSVAVVQASASNGEASISSFTNDFTRRINAQGGSGVSGSARAKIGMGDKLLFADEGQSTTVNYSAATDRAAILAIFEAENVPPDTPTSMGPASLVEGSFTADNAPELEFTLSDDGAGQQVKFHIQVSQNADFSSPVVDYTSALQAQGATSFTVGQDAG